jgi:hypothetical protein
LTQPKKADGRTVMFDGLKFKTLIVPKAVTFEKLPVTSSKIEIYVFLHPVKFSVTLT